VVGQQCQWKLWFVPYGRLSWTCRTWLVSVSTEWPYGCNWIQELHRGKLCIFRFGYFDDDRSPH
jgi:hypothetical protein